MCSDSGGRPGIPFTRMKNAVSDPASGVEPYPIGGAQKAGQTPQSEHVDPVYTEGQKAGLTPHLGFDPAIGAPCKHGECGPQQVPAEYQSQYG